jgi:nicotinamide mononucleotide (NMN) deamidase PncC
MGWWLADTVGAGGARAALADGRSGAVTVSLPGDRERVRQYATITALDLLRRELRSL